MLSAISGFLIAFCREGLVTDTDAVAGVLACDEGQVYYPIFFTHDHAFEEVYCICIQLVNKTWKDMKATYIDFTKVITVEFVYFMTNTCIYIAPVKQKSSEALAAE